MAAKTKHGTRYSYVMKGCRCKKCRKANTEYMRNWQRKKVKNA